MKPKAMLELIRPHNCIIAGIAVLIGGIIGIGGIPSMEIIFAFTAAVIITGAGNAINDYVDRDSDAVNKPERPIPSGKISPSNALIIARILFIVGITLTVFTQKISCIIIAGLNSALLSYYSRSLKNKGLIGNISIGYLVGSTFLFGSLAVGKFATVGILAAMAGLSTTGRELIKDIEDLKGDRASDSKSFPVKYGKKKSAILAIILTIAAIALTPLPYTCNLFGQIYLIIVAIPITLFIIGIGIISKNRDEKSAGRTSLFYKIGMGLGLITFLIGALV